jgi:hypothetical protein
MAFGTLNFLLFEKGIAPPSMGTFSFLFVGLAIATRAGVIP